MGQKRCKKCGKKKDVSSFTMPGLPLALPYCLECNSTEPVDFSETDKQLLAASIKIRDEKRHKEEQRQQRIKRSERSQARNREYARKASKEKRWANSQKVYQHLLYRYPSWDLK